jgi:hypothetical protein
MEPGEQWEELNMGRVITFDLTTWAEIKEDPEEVMA